MQESRRVFQFADPIAYLEFRFQARRRKDPSFSLSAWARRLGYENPSFLSQVLKRERKLKLNLVGRLGRDLGLKGRALRYFECIALQGAATTDAEKRVYLTLARQARPKKLRQLESLTPGIFELVADWHHAALTESVHLAGFDEKTIHTRFSLTRKTAAAALARLEEVGRLARDEQGRLVRAGDAADSALHKGGVPSEAVRAHHLQMIELARAAVHEQSVGERHLTGTTVPIKREHYAKAVEIALEAQRKLLELAAPEGADEVYQLNTQLFKLSKPGRLH